MKLESDALLIGMLRTLRRTLHACPERSGYEVLTATLVAEFLGAYGPDVLIKGLGGHGVAAVYEGAQPGPTVLVRCELDGVQVEEERTTKTAAGPSHLCGHDGHMSIVAGLAPLLHAERPACGRVVLLFQPAEETGEGAARVIADPQFASVWPDYAMALHNLPGYPRGTVVTRVGAFACASVGLQVRLEGIPSHAAEPEKARTPGPVLGRLLEHPPPVLSARPSEVLRQITMTHVRMGRRGFGVTPGRATLCATLRAASDVALEELCQDVESWVADHANGAGLAASFKWLERFPETRSDPQLVGLLADVCQQHEVARLEVDEPFRWSEDFGHFGRICPTLFFGLGIGEDAARLHQPAYLFPDQVIPTGLRVMLEVVRHLTESADAVLRVRVAG